MCPHSASGGRNISIKVELSLSSRPLQLGLGYGVEDSVEVWVRWSFDQEKLVLVRLGVVRDCGIFWCIWGLADCMSPRTVAGSTSD
eukprot:173689-Amorphochlora_amoeboformis.AAC.1